jgi:hypothetical protein
MLTQQTHQTLRDLRLTGMAEVYETQLHDPQVNALSFDERLGLLADKEWNRRQSRRLTRRLKDAKLPLAATIEDMTTRRLAVSIEP